jgi:SAM-dependent methyltransferase
MSFEVMEHNPAWEKTFENMIRLARPGGLVLMSCATVGRPEHGTTRSKPHDSPLTLHWQYYRNLRQSDFEGAINFSDQFAIFRFFTYHYGSDLFFLGIRNGATMQEISTARRAVRILTLRYATRNMLQWHALKKMLLLNTIGETKYFALHGRTPSGLPLSEA